MEDDGCRYLLHGDDDEPKDLALSHTPAQGHHVVVPPSEDEDLVYDSSTRRLYYKTTLLPLPHLRPRTRPLRPQECLARRNRQL